MSEAIGNISIDDILNKLPLVEADRQYSLDFNLSDEQKRAMSRLWAWHEESCAHPAYIRKV